MKNYDGNESIASTSTDQRAQDKEEQREPIYINLEENMPNDDEHEEDMHIPDGNEVN